MWLIFYIDFESAFLMPSGGLMFSGKVPQFITHEKTLLDGPKIPSRRILTAYLQKINITSVDNV
jgi:hypothetical protein